MKKLATGISILFHPLFMTTYLAFFFYFIPALLQPFRPSIELVLLAFCITFLLPASSLFLLYLLGGIDNFTVNTRSQRMLPLVFISLVYLVVTFMLYEHISFSRLTKFMTLLSVLVVCATLITLVYKISLHSLAIWGAVGILLPLGPLVEETFFLLLATLLIVLAGLVSGSRLALNAHTPEQVTMGGIAGFSIGYFGMMILF